MSHADSAQPSSAPAEGPGRDASSTSRRTALLGAMFLMATSAIGPGFITQTSTFTIQLGAAFALAILVSIVIDIAVQMNVWRVIGVAGLRAQELANRLVPGLGWLLAGLVFIGGMVFNIGNIAGTGLGLNAMLGADALIGGAVSALIAIAIFLSKRAGAALDRIVVLLGAVMIGLMVYVAVVSRPPVGDALVQSVNVGNLDSAMFLALATLVGGTVGGYITYAGAHRMIDSGVKGVDDVQQITTSSVASILVTGLMRALLFLAILGVVASGADLGTTNQAANAFQAAAGEVGLRMFGVVFWAAALTSVIGASYTSVSFITTSTTSARTRNMLTVAFIVVCAVLYLVLRQAPTTLLVFAGAFNALILPVGFAVLLIVAAFRRDLLGGYRYPTWLIVVGVLAWLLSVFIAVRAIGPMIALFTGA
ncbi:NRAMP family divalent metal transporter [uncultured Micrococcus sp.]|uniref:NRAMP family divalent metal transporter n=1 Tax=uncultured Micrococcus sp. TaxID=114051 RepID=UPI002600B989|nr:NRAMP family divalent metal transporter [uncultured Micrococcus sp.]